MTTLSPGDPAPLFSLFCDNGTLFDLATERGRFVVIFFYPKDDTKGCTIENCEFSDLAADFAESAVALVGISPDATASHARFRSKYGLKARLAADPDRIAIAAYGVWGEKKLYGRSYMGVVRTTVIIAPDGTIAEILPVKSVPGHAAHVLERVKALAGAA